MTKLPKLGLIYLDHVWRFFTPSNFQGWPDPIETVTYHWKQDKARFIAEVRAKQIDILIGNIPATAYEVFREMAAALPDVRFVPSLNTQFANKSKENVTLFCHQYGLPVPHTTIFYDQQQGYAYLNACTYPKIIKRSYGASNYGGYFVHKVDNAAEATALFRSKGYMPMYIQDCIPLTADIRVMLIGHQPVCAFWRVAGKDQWITNTSQGGHMNYSGVPVAALELAVKASQAAQAEFWACDIAESDGQYYILECATAFAAFPYIRDWIGQYLLWEFAPARFPKPFIPLYHWEALGKVDTSVLRRIRHLAFNDYDDPSADGEQYWREGYEQFPMSASGTLSSIPQATYAQFPTLLPTADATKTLIAGNDNAPACPTSTISAEEAAALPNASASPLEPLTAQQVHRAVTLATTTQGNSDTHSLRATADMPVAIAVEEDAVAPPDANQLDENQPALQMIDINQASIVELQAIGGLGHKRAKAIVEHRTRYGAFPTTDAVLEVLGIGKKLFAKLVAHIRT